MSQTQRPAFLEPSKLGSKKYWDDLYTTELSNNEADSSDTGTVWFDDSGAEAKLVAFLSSRTDTRSDSTSPLTLARPTTSFLDLGCGNGSLLRALRADGWTGRMLGVDYSSRSVNLADRISAVEKEAGTDTDTSLSFRVWDVLAGPYADVLASNGNSNDNDYDNDNGNDDRNSGWDVVLDKGTFDAISLSDEADAAGLRPCERYRERVAPLVRPGGLFLVTSCNWTEDELVRWFAPRQMGGGNKSDTTANGEEEAEVVGGEEGKREDFRFVHDGKVAYRTFSFGGVRGQTISTVCFRKEMTRSPPNS